MHSIASVLRSTRGRQRTASEVLRSSLSDEAAEASCEDEAHAEGQTSSHYANYGPGRQPEQQIKN